MHSIYMNNNFSSRKRKIEYISDNTNLAKVDFNKINILDIQKISNIETNITIDINQLIIGNEYSSFQHNVLNYKKN
jgi:hypothetical protein